MQQTVDSECHSILGRYKLGRKLGKGASCIVRAGLDTQTNQRVAVKLFKYFDE